MFLFGCHGLSHKVLLCWLAGATSPLAVYPHQRAMHLPSHRIASHPIASHRIYLTNNHKICWILAGSAAACSGVWVGVGYTMIGLIAWVGSYFFRVATKNMTYAVQVCPVGAVGVGRDPMFCFCSFCFTILFITWAFPSRRRSRRFGVTDYELLSATTITDR